MEEKTKTSITIPIPSVTKRITVVPILAVLLIIAAFLLGVLITKVQYLESARGNNSTSAGFPTDPTNDSLGTDPSSLGSADNVDKLRDNDHVRGNRNARVLLIEYSDLECPFCKSFHPTAQQAVDDYKGQVAWVYRHFPLDQIHSKADKEAEAVECAGEQGGEDAFWKMADKIFEVTPSNNGLDLEKLPDLAQEIGLNGQTLQKCIDDGKYTQHVEDDYQGGVKAGVNGTPGNILLDTKTGKTKILPGAVPFSEVKGAIDTLIAES